MANMLEEMAELRSRLLKLEWVLDIQESLDKIMHLEKRIKALEESCDDSDDEDVDGERDAAYASISAMFREVFNVHEMKDDSLVMTFGDNRLCYTWFEGGGEFFEGQLGLTRFESQGPAQSILELCRAFRRWESYRSNL